MMELIGEALAAWQGAFEARRLYTPESPIAAQRVESAVEMAAKLCQAHPGAMVMLLPDRVVVGEETLPQGKRLMQGGFANLRARGVCALRFCAPPAMPDFLELLACMEQAGGPVPTLTSIQLLGVDQTGGGVTIGPMSGRIVPVSMVARLQGVLDPLGHKAELESQHLASLTSELAALSITSGDSLIPLSELRTHDEYTYVHTINVAMLSGALAQAMGLAPDKVHDITCAAMLHDVGKVRTPAVILNKQGGFTKQDIAVMRQHPEDGARLLIAAGVKLDVAIAVAYEHHMQRAGGGYPKAPSRWKMHIASQIVQIADIFDALRTNRPYRAAMSLAQAEEAMTRDVGKVFEPAMLQIFFERVARRSLHAA